MADSGPALTFREPELPRPRHRHNGASHHAAELLSGTETQVPKTQTVAAKPPPILLLIMIMAVRLTNRNKAEAGFGDAFTLLGLLKAKGAGLK